MVDNNKAKFILLDKVFRLDRKNNRRTANEQTELDATYLLYEVFNAVQNLCETNVLAAINMRQFDYPSLIRVDYFISMFRHLRRILPISHNFQITDFYVLTAKTYICRIYTSFYISHCSIIRRLMYGIFRTHLFTYKN